MSVELWKSIFDWAAVIMAALTFVAGAGALITGNILSDRQDEKLRHFDKELTDAKTALETQQERASAAESKLAGLQHDTAEAKTEMAKQQTRAATAERSLIELKERVAPRRLTSKQEADFIAALKGSPGTLRLGVTGGGGDEAVGLMRQLMPLFSEAGWKTPTEFTEITLHLELQVTGIALLVPSPDGTDIRKPAPTASLKLTPMQDALRKAFDKAGITLEFMRWYPDPNGTDDLVVGSKPNP